MTPSWVDFRSTVVGTSVDRTISLVNPGSTSVSLTVACQAPFTVVNGSSYTIAPGATQNVVVRFSPTSVATFTGSIAFTADGDMLSSAVTGTATRRARKSYAAASPAIATSDAMQRSRVATNQIRVVENQTRVLDNGAFADCSRIGLTARGPTRTLPPSFLLTESLPVLGSHSRLSTHRALSALNRSRPQNVD